MIYVFAAVFKIYVWVIFTIYDLNWETLFLLCLSSQFGRIACLCLAVKNPSRYLEISLDRNWGKFKIYWTQIKLYSVNLKFLTIMFSLNPQPKKKGLSQT